jgi:TRAP-type C4-dicarboxylate transport system substrate-binding protein
VRGASILVLLALAAPASAEPVVLRLATIAPDGTSWAREVRAFEREVETETNGGLRIKFYFGGVAGDEVESLDRIQRGQLDGGAFSVACSRLAPSLRVMRVVGLLRRSEEAHYVLNRLQPTIEEEFKKSGFTHLAHGLFGSEILFSREPVQTLEDLRRVRFWVWNNDEVWLDELPRLGLNVVPGSVPASLGMYEQGRVDGFLGVPTAALALQWSAQVRYFTPLRIGFLAACLVVANRSYEALPIEWRNVLRGAATKMAARFEDINLSMEEQLIGGLFDRQGAHAVELHGGKGDLRNAFFREARQVRAQLPEAVVPRALIELVASWLTDFRAEANP